jgi:hypothetical protein
MADMRQFARIVLAGSAALGHNSWQVTHAGRPMFSGRGEIPHRR